VQGFNLHIQKGNFNTFSNIQLNLKPPSGGVVRIRIIGTGHTFQHFRQISNSTKYLSN